STTLAAIHEARVSMLSPADALSSILTPGTATFIPSRVNTARFGDPRHQDIAQVASTTALSNFGRHSWQSRASLAPRSAFAHHYERRPLGGVRLPNIALLDQGFHGDAHRLRATYSRLCRQLLESPRGQHHGRLRSDLPMRDEERPRAGVEERTR